MRKTNPMDNSLSPAQNPDTLSHRIKAENDEVGEATLSLVPAILATLESGSNEVHFEQDKQLCRIRKRINGQLDESRIESSTLVAELIEEVRELGSNECGIKNMPAANHGEFSVSVEIHDANLRLNCSYFPTTSGHNLTLKINSDKTIPETLEQSSLDSQQTQELRNHILRASHGLTLVCSSNTDLLQQIYYGMLGEVNCVENKVVSLEYNSAREFPRINQLSLASCESVDNIALLATKHADKLFIDWQSATDKQLMRSVLENYQSAIVFIAAHDSTTAIQQLTDYALNERQLATSLSILVNLEQVREICPHCADRHELSGPDMQWLEDQPLGKKTASAFVYAPGCTRCDYSGSQASATLMSVCEINDKIRSAIESRSSTTITTATNQKLGKYSMASKIESMVANGKVSFTEFKAR